MREIWEALKEKIVDWLDQRGEGCASCIAYRLWVDELRRERDDLKQTLYLNAHLLKVDATTEAEIDWKPIHRHIPLRQRIANREAKNRRERVQEVKDTDKTEAEKTFEEALNKAN